MVYATVIDSGKGPFENNADVAIQARKLMDEQGAIGVTPRDTFTLTNYNVLALTPLNDGQYTLKSEIQFVDITDGEILTLLPGDTLRAWR